MAPDLSSAQLIYLLVLVPAGALAGIMAGLFGIGGGIILVPVLQSVFVSFNYPADLAMHMAVATSLASIVATGLSASLSHARHGSVDLIALRRLAPAVAFGALSGTLVAGYLGGVFLSFLFVAFAATMAILMSRGQKGIALARQLPQGGRAILLGSVIGSLSSMLGIGGGTMSVPTLNACGLTMARAVGTGSALGLCIAVPGVIGFAITGASLVETPPYSLGYVNLLALAVISPLSVLTAPYGVRLAHRFSETALRQGFAIFLIMVAARMLYRLI